MSNANQVAVGIIEEITQGTTPATPAFKGLRITAAPDLAVNPETVVSDEIASDRNISDLALVGIGSGGSLNHEISFEALDLIYEGAMSNPWIDKATRIGTGEVTDITTATDVNVVAGEVFQEGDIIIMEGWVDPANNGQFVALIGTTGSVIKLSSLVNESSNANVKIRTVGFQGASGDIDAVAGGINGLTATALDFTTLGLVPGEWLKIGGTLTAEKFVDPDDNAYVRISTIAASALNFDIVPADWGAETGAGLTIDLWLGSVLTNGITKKFYTIEEQFTDHVPVTYQYMRGMMVDGLTFTLNAKAIVTAEASFLGLSGEITETRFAGSTDEAAPTSDVLNTSSNVGQILENGLAIAGKNFVLDNTIVIANNLREQPAIGVLGAVGIGQGEFSLTGTLNTYFDDKTMVEKVINNTESAYNLVLRDNAEQALLIDLPRIKFASGFPEVSGKNTDTTVNLGFQAIKHPILGYTMLMQRFYVVEV